MWPEARSRADCCVDGFCLSPGKMQVVAVLALCLQLLSLCSGQYHLRINFLQSRIPKKLLDKRMLILDHEIMMSTPALSPAKPPENWPMSSLGSKSTPTSSPHDRDCDGIFCSEPHIAAPVGLQCGCVLPLKVIIDIGVAPHRLFTHITEFKVEVAAGAFLKQSQIQIMAAAPSLEDPGKTRIALYLLPLDEKFDNMTASFIYERFWQKRVPIQMHIFGDYEVKDIHYPGLPPSPSGGYEFPFAVDVSTGKARRLNFGIIIIAFSSFTLILACVGIILFALKWMKLSEPHISSGPAVTQSRDKRTGFRSIMSFSTTSTPSASFISTMAICPSVRTFSLSELEKATDQFNPRRILGKGGFGCVYHGLLEDGSDIAVKVLTKRNQNGERGFIAEIEMLSRLHHRNLVKLIGICIEGSKRCLVCELVRNGNLESHLHGAKRNKGPLDWDARMRIALGAARGLAYLHEDCNPHVIHRDFKSSNILLEEDFTPKVSDFGLAREASEGGRHISARVVGTFGYVAPEYAMTGHSLIKSDVYSYGVVLLELLSGRKPVYMSQSGGPENLVAWAQPLLSNREGVEQLIDPFLSGNCNMDHAVKVAAIASLCVLTEPSQRPFMGEVLQALKLLYSDTEGGCADFARQESSSGVNYDYRGDFDIENSLWHRDSPYSAFDPPFMTMEYSSDPVDGVQRPRSASQMDVIDRHNSSGPLRTKRNKKEFYKLRGSISEHEHLSKHGHVGSSL